MTSMIALQRVAKSYGSRKILTDVTLAIAPRQWIGVVGESGSGKTTLVKLLLRAEAPTGGKILVDGVDLAMLPAELLQMYRQRVGVLSSAVPLVDEWTLEENVAYPLVVRGIAEAQRRKRTADVLKRLELQGRAGTLAVHLSGSERALGELARAIVAQPAVIIADEPSQELAIPILTEAHKRGTTVLLLTQDRKLLPAHAQVAHLKDGICVTSANHAAHAHKASHEPLLHLSHAEAPEPAPVRAPAKAAPAPSAPSAPAGKSGRKIRITSIGSDLG